MKDKKQVRKIIKNSLNLRFNIKPLSPSQEQIEKKLFIDIITIMKEIQDRSYFLESEIGITTVGYEDKFYRVIESLFRLHFNKEQLSLIQLYLYELSPDKSWDGMLDLDLKEKGTQTVTFKDPKDVWDVLTLFK
tara:strand:+ start:8748 stop:9149 length:402 start_codon:yes stop_codon:yes gene_type:complete